MKVIKYEDAINLLVSYGILEDAELKELKDTTIDPWNNCLECGHPTENCICVNNKLLGELRELSFEVRHA
jgi:biotin synthase-like enzyme